MAHDGPWAHGPYADSFLSRCRYASQVGSTQARQPAAAKAEGQGALPRWHLHKEGEASRLAPIGLRVLHRCGSLAAAAAAPLPTQAAGASSHCQLVPNKTHTAFLIEDPMRGGKDLLMDLVLAAVTGTEQNHVYTSLCPGFLCDLAGWVCPF